jgi:hypothetical protein
MLRSECEQRLAIVAKAEHDQRSREPEFLDLRAAVAITDDHVTGLLADGDPVPNGIGVEEVPEQTQPRLRAVTTVDRTRFWLSSINTARPKEEALVIRRQ